MKARNFSKLTASAVAALAIGAAGAGSARAGDILFNDFGPGYSYSGTGTVITGSGSALGGPYSPASEFTPSFTEPVSSITVAIAMILSAGTHTVTMNLMTDSSGPGSIIESYTFTNVPLDSVNLALSTASSVTHPVLTAGTPYWLAAIPGASDTSGNWFLNDQGQIGPQFESFDGGNSWTNVGPNDVGAFEVLGTLPEPASLLILGLGGTALIARRRRS